MNSHAPPPEDGDEAPRDPRLSTQFRALPMGGTRKAFRLEAVYWEALQAIAARNNRTVVEEVAKSLADADPKGNDAAALRAKITGDLLDLWRVSASRQAKVDWRKLIEETPGDAFVMTVSQNLVAMNQRLCDKLSPLGIKPIQTPEGVRGVTLAVEASAITQIERRGAFMDCSVGFLGAGARLVRRARLGPASEPGQGQILLLGFVQALA